MGEEGLGDFLPLDEATTPPPQPQPGILQNLFGLANQYLQFRQMKETASAQQQILAMQRSTPPLVRQFAPGGVPSPGGISLSTILLGGGAIVGGYFLLNSLIGGKKQRG